MTFISPFDSFGQPAKGPDDWEDIEGAFGCLDCNAVVHSARYSDSTEIVTWKCPNGHTSKTRMKL